MYQTYKSSLPQIPAWLLLWLPLLVGLQGVPHTGALRTLALLVGMIHVVTLMRTAPATLTLTCDRLVVLTFWTLMFWMVCQTSFIAHAPVASFRALIGDWAKFILMALLGFELAKAVQQPLWLYTCLFLGAFLHVLSVLSYQGWALLSGHGIIFQRSFLSEYPLASHFCISAIIWLFADLVSRFWRKRPFFPWPRAVSIMLLGMALLAEAFLQTKAGHVVLAVIGLIMVLALFPIAGRKLRLVGAVSLFMLLGAMLVVGGNRWSGLMQSLRAAQADNVSLQVFVSDAAPIPKGVNHSFYMRAVRGWQGIKGVMEYPLGIGYGPDVFKRYLEISLGIDDGINSSNSGLIDFTLAVGAPGLVLLLLLCAILFERGWRAYKQGQVAGLALSMFVIHQLSHYALDGTLGGSRLTGPALAIAALWGLCRKYPGDSRTDLSRTQFYEQR